MVDRVPRERLELGLGPPVYRPDIDGLRAVAVLSVVAFHAFPEAVTGGFIGVDVFFVISGYLITSIILSAFEKDAFSYVDFYGRRIRRILPALVLVLAATLVLGWVVLLPGEFRSLGKHVLAGAAFLTNVASWRESGYFDSAAAAKPLLHLWSLAIEEQFYIFWPIIVGIAWRVRRVGWTIAACAVLSFGLGLYLLRDDPVAAFYSPFSRFWELMIGSLLAWWTLKRDVRSAIPGNATAALGALLLVVGLATIDETSAFPGWRALLPTVGTALLIAAGPTTWINGKIFSARPLVAIGLVSYPLYLWHWPLLCLASIVAVDPLSVEVRVLLLLLSIGLAWLTFVLVERPIRSHAGWKLQPVALLAGLGAMGLSGGLVFVAEGVPTRAVVGRVRDAVAVAAVENRRSECQAADGLSCLAHYGRGARYRVVVWGDSHARMWAAALAPLAERRDFELLAVGVQGCPPLLGIRMGVSGTYAPPCSSMGSQERVFKQIIDFKPDLVILAARWSIYAHGWTVNGKLDKASAFPTQEATGAATVETARRALIEKIPFTVRAFTERSIPVLVVRNPPVLQYDVANARKSVPEIEVRRADHDRLSAFTDAIFAALPGLEILDTADRLCDATCKARLGPDYLYVDDNHLSKVGVRLFAEDLDAVLERTLSRR